ncbi:hypothetical protein HPP92_028674 [Vanilla planifolia]|uniref:Uncharacterized protein n=1 Tax=Vanilla planifolia TaxID=51239 RepID=A0A835P6K0_VANPL|nr:hypothetical protein HPP92_028674 [Vanilla planifolia]
MDLVGFFEVEAFASSSPCSFPPPLSSSDIESSTKKGFFGSSLLKQGKTSRDEGDDPRCPKTARSIHHSGYSNGGQQMLHLSSKDSSSLMHSCENPTKCSRAGLNCGNLNARLMGPFTAPPKDGPGTTDAHL